MPDSPTFDRHPVSDWDSSLASIRDAMNGRPLHVHELLARHPALLAAWWPLRMHCVAGSSLHARDLELVILRTAVHLRCWYEWASHVVRGQAAGLSREEIERVLGEVSNDGWSEREATLLNAVDALNTKQRLPIEILSELERAFTPEQVLDVIATHSMYTMLGCILNTRPVALDAEVRARLPEGMTEAWFLDLAGRR